MPQWVAAPGDGAYVRAVLVREGESAFGVSTVLIERSVDGGRTWTAAQLPVKSAASFPDDGAVTPPEGGPGDSLLFAVDGTLVVADADLANARRVTTPGSAPRAVCDAQRRCLVGYDDPTRAGERIAATFDGTAFGSPRPGLPLQAVAAGDGTVVGLRTSGSGTTVRSRDLGGSYDDLPLIDDGEWLRAPPPQLARRVGERIDLTLDGVDWRSISHPPSASPLVAVHLAPGGAIGLAEDGRVWRQHDGRWTSWDASALEPSAVATSGAAELVAGFAGLLRRTRAGTRRVVQVAEDGTVRIGGRRVAWVPAAAEWSLAARGPLVLAWTRVGDEGRRMPDLGGLLRSTDGGRTFRRIASARSTDALQIVDARTVYRTDRSGLYVSHDGGRRFRLRNRLDLLADGVDEGGLAFSTPRSGVVGRSVTRDGGRSLTPVPFVPGGERLLGAHGAAVLESGPFQVPMAARHLLDTAVRPRMTLRLRSRSRWGRGVVAAEVSGTLSDAPAGTVVDLVAAPTRSGIRRHQAIDTLVTDERGRFSGSVQLRTERDRLLQAWFPGVVEGDRTVLGARSRWLAVPR
ncbi:WD40/YVTN/BNR-like repeat-containing protein [Patulibacter medicamentivorans]|uniref:WD40/YVTN/BNR-like repeat-containing protein n=1 Tax=Patulibacter medicamentivorans TaxID=1097667 RepID=UPI001110D2AE|nr:hypothetical protein [Patulibacter medicamentivorans]